MVSLKSLPPHARKVVMAQANITSLPRTMNKLEAKFAHFLDTDSTVLSWLYESVTLKLADDTRYTPDFMAIYDHGAVVFYEVKGFMRDDARVKLRVAATRFPWFQFWLAKFTSGNWDLERINQI